MANILRCPEKCSPIDLGGSRFAAGQFASEVAFRHMQETGHQGTYLLSLTSSRPFRGLPREEYWTITVDESRIIDVLPISHDDLTPWLTEERER